jgi:hypothetical protein
MSVFTKLVPKMLSAYSEEENFEFSSEGELLHLPCVACWTQPVTPHQKQNDSYFHRFSLKGYVLVVETFGGKYHHDIGVLSDITGLTLPKWTEFDEKNTKGC